MDKDDDLNDFIVPKEESTKTKRQLFASRNQEPKSKKAKVDSKSELKDFDLLPGIVPVFAQNVAMTLIWAISSTIPDTSVLPGILPFFAQFFTFGPNHEPEFY